MKKLQNTSKIKDSQFTNFNDWKDAAGGGEIKQLFDEKIKPNLKKGDVVYNRPLPNEEAFEKFGLEADKKPGNRRGLIYQRMAGFGPVQKDGGQHGVVVEDNPQGRALKPIGQKPILNHDD